MSDSKREKTRECGGFAVGDVVRLKSGGPAMTIDSFVEGTCKGARGDDDVVKTAGAICVWFQKHGDRSWGGVQQQPLDLDLLVKAPAES